MDFNPDHPADSTAAEATAPVRKPVDDQAVAQIAQSLAQVKANPASEADREAARSHMQTFGLEAFFQAALRTMDAGPMGVTTPMGGAAPAVRQAQEAESFGIGLVAPGALGVRGDQGQVRQTWQDWIGSRKTQPLRIYHPATRADLIAILREAEAKDCRVKAVGSGHSFSDVAATRDFLVETHGLNRPLALDQSVLRPDAAPETLFETEAGIIIHDLNEALWAAGLGLLNMGGYDGQTIAGVISTSTHGSGLAFGPLPDQVVSLTVAAAGGRMVRIEPAGGITDPVKWAVKHPDIELKQLDDWFHACQVSLGCMGIVYSVVLRVRPRYYLKEQRTLSTWSQVRQDLPGGLPVQVNSHYEVLVNPYATLPGGDHTCLVTRRNPVADPEEDPSDLPQRNFLVELAASIPGSGQALLGVLNAFPDFTPHIIDEAMRSIAGTYLDRSFRVYNIGAANNVPSYGSEIGFPLDHCVPAVEQILAITGRRQALGQAYLNSPFSLRFVKESPAHLSMMQGVDTCMVELISLDQTVGGKELLQEIETEMYAFGGRPHWGLLNFISGGGGLVEAMYPLLPRWQAVRESLDPKGRFANAFSERSGLTPRPFVRD